MPFHPSLTQSGPDVLIQIKAVPGASRERVVGMLGDRLKVAVAAAPEDGKANKAICALLAKALGVPAKSVEVCAGHTHPRKTLRVAGAHAGEVAAKLAAGVKSAKGETGQSGH